MESKGWSCNAARPHYLFTRYRRQKTKFLANFWTSNRVEIVSFVIPLNSRRTKDVRRWKPEAFLDCNVWFKGTEKIIELPDIQKSSIANFGKRMPVMEIVHRWRQQCQLLKMFYALLVNDGLTMFCGHLLDVEIDLFETTVCISRDWCLLEDKKVRDERRQRIMKRHKNPCPRDFLIQIMKQEVFRNWIWPKTQGNTFPLRPNLTHAWKQVNQGSKKRSPRSVPVSVHYPSLSPTS